MVYEPSPEYKINREFLYSFGFRLKYGKEGDDFVKEVNGKECEIWWEAVTFFSPERFKNHVDEKIKSC